MNLISHNIHGISTHLDAGIPPLGMCPEAVIKRTTRFTCKKKFIVAIVIVMRNWKPLKSPQRSD